MTGTLFWVTNLFYLMKKISRHFGSLIINLFNLSSWQTYKYLLIVCVSFYFCALISSKHSTFIVSHSHSSAISVNCHGFLSRSLFLPYTLFFSAFLLILFFFCFSNCLSRVQMNSPLCVQFESFLPECVCVCVSA